MTVFNVGARSIPGSRDQHLPPDVAGSVLVGVVARVILGAVQSGLRHRPGGSAAEGQLTEAPPDPDAL